MKLRRRGVTDRAAEKTRLVRYVNPDSLPLPRGYNNGVLMAAGGGSRLLFIAGQIGWDRDGRLVSDRFAEQFERALQNLLAVVIEAGGQSDSIGKLTVFVIDKAEYLAERAAIGAAYRRQMQKHFPAMSLVEVTALLEPGARVEIEGMAVIKG